MPQEVKTVQVSTGVDSSTSKLTHTESNGDWFIDEVRVKCNGDGDDSANPEFDFGLVPTGETVKSINGELYTNKQITQNTSEKTYWRINIEEYCDFDTEDVNIECVIDGNATFDLYLHLRRVL